MTDEVKQQVADWIESEVIADDIANALEEEGLEPSFANAERVWLDVLLCELTSAVRRSVSALASKGDIS
jgi:hypothetical protein